MRGQSIKDTAKEAFTNIGIGFIGSWIIVFLCMKYIPSASLAATVSCILCTLWSFIRSFTIRRYFNNLQEKENVTETN